MAPPELEGATWHTLYPRAAGWVLRGPSGTLAVLLEGIGTLGVGQVGFTYVDSTDRGAIVRLPRAMPLGEAKREIERAYGDRAAAAVEKTMEGRRG